MHRTVRDLEIPDNVKVLMIEKLAEADFRLSEGANSRIQIEAVVGLKYQIQMLVLLLKEHKVLNKHVLVMLL